MKFQHFNVITHIHWKWLDDFDHNDNDDNDGDDVDDINSDSDVNNHVLFSHSANLASQWKMFVVTSSMANMFDIL